MWCPNVWQGNKNNNLGTVQLKNLLPEVIGLLRWRLKWKGYKSV